MPSPTPISWVILAGGQATRMGGQDKGLVRLNDTPLIEHVISRISPHADELLINANRNHDTYAQYAPVIGDEFGDYPGPLGGIHAGLVKAKHDWVGFVPCDSPLIKDDLTDHFEKAIHSDVDILVAHDGGHVQPVFTLFHKRVLDRLEAFLERGDRKIILLYDECRTEYVDFSHDNQSFINLNTPEELQQFGTLI